MIYAVFYLFLINEDVKMCVIEWQDWNHSLLIESVAPPTNGYMAIIVL